MEIMSRFFSHEKISSFGLVPYDERFLLREDILKRKYTAEKKTLCAFAVPYYVPDVRRNMSSFCVPRDYHIYFEGLYDRLSEYLSLALPGLDFCGFADNSPFDERALALACGLGVRGDNGLLIDPVYGSYVFIGSIVFSRELPYEFAHPDGQRTCTHCGLCKAACPSRGECLSHITQKGGELTEGEKKLIAAGGSAWGCDICQSVCPANEEPIVTPIEFFVKDRLPFVTADMISNMSDGEFSRRAYAWKGKGRILRNLEILASEGNNDIQ